MTEGEASMILEVPMRVREGDLLIKDNQPARVQRITEDEIQLASPGGFTDTVLAHEEFTQQMRAADHVQLIR